VDADTKNCEEICESVFRNSGLSRY